MHRRETDAPSPQSECSTPSKKRKKRQPIQGRRFGKLIAIERVENRGSYWMWRCKCDCGNEHVLPQPGLSNGDYISCGCARNSLKGRTFGKLTAIEPTGNRTSSGDAFWRCKCECGNEAIVNGSSLHARGGTKSCGCLRLVLAGKTFGRLTVLEPVGKKRGHVEWRCVCSCGNEVIASNENLSKRKSCGCTLGSAGRRKTHCPQGHRYSSENTYVTPNGHRQCKACSRSAEKGRSKRVRARKAPGFHTPAQWFARIRYHGNRCRYCGSYKNLTMDHMIPIARGGSNWPSNLVPACEKCNFKKHTKTYKEFIKDITGVTHGRRTKQSSK